MPLIALDDVGRLISQHPKLPFLQSNPLEALPEFSHQLVSSLGCKQLWQLLTFTKAELLLELNTLNGKSEVVDHLVDHLAPFELNLREQAPYALKTLDHYVKIISVGMTSLTKLYEEATLFWDRWEAMRAASKLQKSFPGLKIVFRSETLKLGFVVRV